MSFCSGLSVIVAPATGRQVAPATGRQEKAEEDLVLAQEARSGSVLWTRAKLCSCDAGNEVSVPKESGKIEASVKDINLSPHHC